MVQLGRRDAGRFGDGLDLGLLAPMAADMADGAAHHLVIGGGSGERHRGVASVGSGMRSGDSMGASIMCSRSRLLLSTKPPDFCIEG